MCQLMDLSVTNEMASISDDRMLLQPLIQSTLCYYSGVGYIRLQSFSSNACAQVKSAMQELQKGGNLKSLVLDLRDNPGGLLSSAVDVAELFVPKGS